MDKVKVHQFIPLKALVTRASARLLRDPVASIAKKGTRELWLDFSAIEAITPSFLDETFRVVHEEMNRNRIVDFQIHLINLPTHLSTKFTAIARAHSFDIRETSPNWWIATPKRSLNAA